MGGSCKVHKLLRLVLNRKLFVQCLRKPRFDLRLVENLMLTINSLPLRQRRCDVYTIYSLERR